MGNVSLLGIPLDENSSFKKGAAEAPAFVRRELQSDAYSSWSETGVDFGVAGSLVDHGTSNSEVPMIRGTSLSGVWARRWNQAIR